MTFFADHPGLLVLGVCLIAGVALIVMGALRLLRAAGSLRKRVAAYQELPFRGELELAEARLAAAERRAASIPALLARSRTALAEIQAARAKVVAIQTTLSTLLRLSGFVLKGS
ncbi:MAG: hypothetical protein M3R53_09315 [Candidatus Eremiobacteraeota bacterium]|nr:hypothetical protein [Candidatus Eremiobacteraeota bacterium]